jgi:hypothetical protein
MKVVFVHGRAQENKDPAELEGDWRTALSDGIVKAGGIVPNPLESAFPYYGNLLFGLTNGTIQADRSSLTPKGVASSNPQELEFFADVTTEIVAVKGLEGAAAAADLKARDFQNWESVLATLRLVDHVPYATDFSISTFLKDVWTYLTNKGVRLQIDALVDADIPKPGGESCIVVAHSLGTIVAYNVLRQRKDLTNVRGFVTIGSPLGIEAITKKLPSAGGTRSTPPVPFWFNGRDKQDTVALREITAFGGMPKVLNYSDVENTSHNHHGAVEYLSDKAVAQATYRVFQE